MKFEGSVTRKGKVVKGEASKGIEAALFIAMQTACIIVLGQAKALCTVDTGRLRGSIIHKVVK